MTPRVPRFAEGDQVILMPDHFDRVKRSYATQGGQWIYLLESGKLAEEALLRILPQQEKAREAAPKDQPKGYGREPGQEG